jgi:hypothetical protein
LSAATRLRFAVANLLRQDFVEQSLYDDGARRLLRYDDKRGFATWRVTWERGW